MARTRGQRSVIGAAYGQRVTWVEPPTTVHAVLRRHAMHRLTWLDRRTGQLIRRYERARPGELVHVDGVAHRADALDGERPVVAGPPSRRRPQVAVVGQRDREAVVDHPRAGDLLQPGNVEDDGPALRQDVVLVAPSSSRAGYVSLALRTVSYRQRNPRPVSTTDLQVPSAEP
jgi:hypothetical protein